MRLKPQMGVIVTLSMWFRRKRASAVSREHWLKRNEMMARSCRAFLQDGGGIWTWIWICLFIDGAKISCLLFEFFFIAQAAFHFDLVHLLAGSSLNIGICIYI